MPLCVRSPSGHRHATCGVHSAAQSVSIDQFCASALTPRCDCSFLVRPAILTGDEVVAIRDQA